MLQHCHEVRPSIECNTTIIDNVAGEEEVEECDEDVESCRKLNALRYK